MAQDSPVTPQRPARFTSLSFFFLLTLGVPLAASAGPLIIEEVAKITSPEPDFAFGAPFGSGVSRVAIDGDFMLVSGTRQIPDTLDEEQAVFLFRRASNGTWAYVRKTDRNFKRVPVGGRFVLDELINPSDESERGFKLRPKRLTLTHAAWRARAAVLRQEGSAGFQDAPPRARLQLLRAAGRPRCRARRK